MPHQKSRDRLLGWWARMVSDTQPQRCVGGSTTTLRWVGGLVKGERSVPVLENGLCPTLSVKHFPLVRSGFSQLTKNFFGFIKIYMLLHNLK